MGYPLEIAWSVEIFVVAQICNMMLARKIRQMRISQMAPGKQISRGGGVHEHRKQQGPNVHGKQGSNKWQDDAWRQHMQGVGFS
jgi:hypothetical protein